MSGTANPSEVAELIRGGANGFLPKTLGPEIFVQALNVVLAGGTYLPAELLTALDGERSPLPAAPPAAPADPASPLTPRELQVLRAIVQGRSNKEIARELDLQEVTVKLHGPRAPTRPYSHSRAAHRRSAMSSS